MCSIALINSSSGLSGCQCCMISVEHGLESLKAGHRKCIQTVPTCQWSLPCDQRRPRADACHRESEGGCSNEDEPLVTYIFVPFTLSDFTGNSQGPLFGQSPLYYSIFPHCLLFSHAFSALSVNVGPYKANAHKHSHTHTHTESFSISRCSPNLRW